jgi:hypothetical protein
MLDKLITYIVWYIISCLLRELTALQLVVIATRSDTASHNRLDLIQILYHHTMYVMGIHVYYFFFKFEKLKD